MTEHPNIIRVLRSDSDKGYQKEVLDEELYIIEAALKKRYFHISRADKGYIILSIQIDTKEEE